MLTHFSSIGKARHVDSRVGKKLVCSLSEMPPPHVSSCWPSAPHPALIVGVEHLLEEAGHRHSWGLMEYVHMLVLISK